MPNIWLISDTHFGQESICSFKLSDGSKLRPWDNVDKMDEELIERWNGVVKPNDTIYHLGDVVYNRKALATISKLNGSKRLILGNHDIFDYSDYAKYFKRLHGSFKLDDLLLTHIPVHTNSIAKWTVCNIHGHIHNHDIPDGRYFNVSVERINYTPISLEDLRISVNEKAIKYAIDNTQESANVAFQLAGE